MEPFLAYLIFTPISANLDSLTGDEVNYKSVILMESSLFRQETIQDPERKSWYPSWLPRTGLT
jgi:hypothetical protein